MSYLIPPRRTDKADVDAFVAGVNRVKEKHEAESAEIESLTAKLEAAEKENSLLQQVETNLTELHNSALATITEQAAQIEALEKDAARIDWLQHWFMHSWNGVVGVGSSTIWSLCGDYRSRAAKMKGREFREAIDAAILGESHVR